ncbi:MAG: O-methyltransferase [Chitinophagaceae bacterium]
MELINPQALAYAERFTSPEDVVLRQIAEATRRSHEDAHMLSGQWQGQFLQFISGVLKPNYILEIGTYTGYSAVCLSRGLQPGGELHTIELQDKEADTAQENFYLAGVQERVVLHRGNALKIIPTLHKTWDLVFIDADKKGYLDYYRLVLPQLRAGGVILADNVLFHGEVLEKKIKGQNALAIHAFNEYVYSDESVEKVLLTIRDGLLLITKK